MPLHATRRAFLQRASGALGLGGVARNADRDRTVRVVVGYATRRARRTVRHAATRVHRGFAFDAVSVDLSRQELERLHRRSDVRYVEPVRWVAASGGPGLIDKQRTGGTLGYGVNRIDADVAHEHGKTGDGVHVAVLDTGIDRGHETLDANLGDGKAIRRADFFHLTPWDDDHGHGTHCAGTIGATADDEKGVSPEVTLHAVKVLNSEGVGGTDDLAAGIEYAVDQGWDVVNLSVASERARVVEDACSHAAENDVLVVAAAPMNDDMPYPATLSTCLAVGATDEYDRPAGFTPDDGTTDLVAPGVDIRSADPGGYRKRSGTSMAAAHVSGAAAQLLADGRDHDEVRSRLADTAQDLQVDSRLQGEGLVDVAAALGYDSDDDLPRSS